MTRFSVVEKILKKELSKHRFEHSLAVARLAGELAEIHGWNVDEARMCGLVHDCAKEWRPKDLIAHVAKQRLAVPHLDLIVQNSPGLLHAYVSADVAAANKWITSRAARQAISAHTLGCLPMGRLDAIVFIADLAAYDRTFSGARGVRKVARKNLRAGLREALAVKLGHQLRKGKKIHPMPVAVWNSLLDGPA